MNFENHATLTKAGLDQARRNGVTLGRPVGSKLSSDSILTKHPDIVRHLRAEHSIRHAAKITGKATATVQAVKRAMEITNSKKP
jgi:DNA invertase Pin-like site-specific DNA recombinase